MNGISKSFGSLRALDDVSIEFRTSEIHAIIGENGAGKSTLMNVIGGFVRPDAGIGSIARSAALGVGGHVPMPFGDPLLARRAGIEMVHQHFMLVPEFSVIENLALSTLGPLYRTLETPLTRFESLAEKLGWRINFQARTGSLPVGVQQRVEILKALAADRPVLILDEPTAVLSEAEVEDLFRVLRELRNDRKTIILIAHKLREIMAGADHISVLRSGRLVGSTPIAEAREDDLRLWMLGQRAPLSDEPEVNAPTHEREREIGNVLEIKGLQVLRDRSTDLSVKRGQIVGIGGVDGNGQVELAEAIVGVESFPASSMKVAPHLAYIPQDRQRDGLALNMSIRDNFLLTEEQPWLLVPGRVRQRARELVETYKIKVQSLDDRAASLSGGNQQKIVVSRALESRPDLIVAVNPTRGLDFAATQFVHEALRKAARSGAGIVLITTDRDEFNELSDVKLYIDRGVLHDEGWLK